MLSMVTDGETQAYQECLDRLSALRAEIERLSEGERAADAEIERLRALLLSRSNALGRIAAALFGDGNGHSDEDCVAAAAEVGYELTGCRERCDSLRRACSTWERACTNYSEAVANNEAKIERLRGDISRLEQQQSRTIHRAATEIEQLRETLRHVIANPWNWNHGRVREALGE